MKVLGIDPGIAHVATALFDTDRIDLAARDPRDSSGHLTAIHGLEKAETLRTDSSDPESMRTAAIFAYVLDTLTDNAVERIVVEIPQTWHRKTMGRKQGAGAVLSARAKMNRGIGAVLAAMGMYVLAAESEDLDVHVHERPAHKGAKVQRRDIVDRLLATADFDASRNEHEADAIFYGLEETIEALALAGS